MFKLLRYFSVASLISFVIVAILLVWFYRQIVLNELVESAESKNIALTQAFSNSLWPQFAPFVDSASDLTSDELRTHPQITNLHQAVLEQMRGLSVVKVKVYDLDGVTVFSTEASQIGDDKSNNAGYLAARSGQIASELTHRDTFSAFEGTIEDRDVFSSYIPIRRGGPTLPVEGVFEVYDDVTPLIQRLEQAQRTVIIGVTLVLAILYTILFFIVRRANQVIEHQYDDLKQAQEALGQARDEALAASQFKSQLLAKVSHELRTPLGSILGYSEILQKGMVGPMTPKQTDFLQKVISGTHYLTQLVNELLDQAQFENGKEKLYLTDFTPQDIVHQVETRLRILAEEKGLTLVTDISPDLPNTLVGDTKRLEQILMNLVSNAIKFTKAGTVQVRLYPSASNQWIIQVSDTGIGIPFEAQDSVFEPFQQVDGSITREYSGTGLGLSIVSQLVALMEGEVDLESKPEQGSIFTVTLPIQSRSTENGKSISINN